MIAHISDDGRKQSVLEHICGTAEIAEREAAKNALGNTAWICGALHDFGKLNNRFEEYILDSFLNGGSKSKSVPHSSAGAHYVYYDDFENFNLSRLFREIIAVVLSSHHGVYDCVRPDGRHRSTYEDRWIADENYEEALKNFNDLFVKENIKEISETVTKAEVELKTIDDKIRGLAAKKRDEYCFYQGCFVRLLLSYLVYGDWKDTGEFMNGKAEDNDYNIPEIWVQCLVNFEQYMSGLRKEKRGSEKIRRYREELSWECANAAKISSGIYSLSMPTGGGKTLSSLNFALRHAIENKKERILYISPFLSILEQNSDVIRKAINNDEIILEHHSNVAYVPEDEKEGKQSIERKNSLEIDWDYPIVLTTLVQFMNTLFSDKLQCIRRMHWLANSVIIIDEVQAIPVRCISTFNLMINFLANVCNATVILCTATQPLLGENAMTQNPILKHKIIYGEPKELINDVEKRFIQFERTKVIPALRDKKYGIEEIRDFVSDICCDSDSVLVVLNTKSAVEQLVKGFENYRDGETRVYSLTTNLCPEHRSDVIGEIKEILDGIRHGSGERILVISTSLIEAGVDISFRTAIRALSGLDSIIQTAGRCNRQGEAEYGSVYIINTNEYTGKLRDTEEGAKAAEHVIRDLHQKGRIEELFLPASITNYYLDYYCNREEEMDYNIEVDGIKTTEYRLLSDNLEAVRECKKQEEFLNTKINQAFKSGWSGYKVIDDDTIGIIVPYKAGKDYCEKIRNAQTAGEIKDYIKKAQRYTVNVYRNKLYELINCGAVSTCDLYHSVYVLHEDFYKDNLGITKDFQNYIF